MLVLYIRSLVWHTVLHLNFILQGTYVTTVTASDGDTMLNAPVEYFIDTGILNKTKKTNEFEFQALITVFVQEAGVWLA